MLLHGIMCCIAARGGHVQFEEYNPDFPEFSNLHSLPWEKCPAEVQRLAERASRLAPPRKVEMLMKRRGPRRKNSSPPGPPLPPPPVGAPHKVLDEGKKAYPFLPKGDEPKRNALAVEAELTGLRSRIRQLQAEITRLRSEKEEAVTRASSDRNVAVRREILRRVLEEFLRKWGASFPEDFVDLPEMLPLPLVPGTDGGTVAQGRPKMKEAAVSPTRSTFSISFVQTDETRGVEGGAGGGDLLQKMEEILEACLTDF